MTNIAQLDQLGSSWQNIFAILHDPFWQFICLISVACIGIVVSIFIFFSQKTKKILNYEFRANNSLFRIHREIATEVKISYRGVIVKDMQLIVLRIKNSSDVPILKSDFDEPLQIIFTKPSHVISFDISDNGSDALNIRMEKEDETVIIEPLLMNPLDYFDIQIIVSEYCNIPRIHGRVVGVKHIAPINTKSISRFRFMYGAITGLILAFPIGVWFDISILKIPAPIEYKQFIIFISTLIFMALSFPLVIYIKKHNKIK